MTAYMRFSEHCSWEGESWDVYSKLESEEQRSLAERFVDLWNDREIGPHRSSCYKVRICEMPAGEVQALCDSAREGYYDSIMEVEMGDEVMDAIENVIEIIEDWEDSDGPVDWDEYLYKLKLFFG